MTVFQAIRVKRHVESRQTKESFVTPTCCGQHEARILRIYLNGAKARIIPRPNIFKGVFRGVFWGPESERNPQNLESSLMVASPRGSGGPCRVVGERHIQGA